MPSPWACPVAQHASAFALDPEIKSECIWAGARYRPASACWWSAPGRWCACAKVAGLAGTGPAHAELRQPVRPDRQRSAVPEVCQLRESIRRWRFYDHFRSDAEAPARQPQLGTRTPVLHHDGRDLAAALQTIREIGDPEALDAPSTMLSRRRLHIDCCSRRTLCRGAAPGGLAAATCRAAELSDGTLRYLLLVAALLTPRPPSLMVLNEPETSLHPGPVAGTWPPDHRGLEADARYGWCPMPAA